MDTIPPEVVQTLRRLLSQLPEDGASDKLPRVRLVIETPQDTIVAHTRINSGSKLDFLGNFPNSAWTKHTFHYSFRPVGGWIMEVIQSGDDKVEGGTYGPVTDIRVEPA